jgi:hypothetical protein
LRPKTLRAFWGAIPRIWSNPMSARENEEFFRSLERERVPEWVLELLTMTSLGLFVFVTLFWCYLLIGD